MCVCVFLCLSVNAELQVVTMKIDLINLFLLCIQLFRLLPKGFSKKLLHSFEPNSKIRLACTVLTVIIKIKNKNKNKLSRVF